MNRTKTLDLTQGAIFKVLLAFVLPILAGSLIQQLYTVVDAVVVGRFAGQTGLAAIDSVYTLFKFPLNFMSGLAAGATIVISKCFGAGDEKNLSGAIRAALVIAAALGVVFSLAGAFAAPVLADVMQVPADIRPQTLLYVRIYFGGLWTLVLYNMLAGILRAFGNSKSPFYILIICGVVNIAGDLLLVGVFRAGVAGAAAATVAAQFISVALAMRSLTKTYPGGAIARPFRDGSPADGSPVGTSPSGEMFPRGSFRLRKDIGHMLAIGFPLGLQGILFPVANSIIHAQINKMGTEVIAAWAVCGKLDLLIWLVA
ncbi:MAG: polysaccharide biosynthesis C-terminal domain-containing protein, partial [Lachnospiraceae bacterium]|nr:polysaccharide biosynthesis C-terminal domain-containing protein [Lachnospiraceae bacterium]